MKRKLSDCSSSTDVELTEAPVCCLPDHILRQIMGYLPKKDRKEIAKVCYRFYDIDWEIDKFNKTVYFKSEHFDDSSIYDSILSTQKRFKKVYFEIKNENISKISAFLDVHGNSIESMHITVYLSDPIENNFSIMLFKKLPNLVSLNMNIVNFYVTDNRIQGEMILPKLRHLQLYNFTTDFSGQFFSNFLPKNVLKTLKITGDKLVRFETLIANQAGSIEDLRLNNQYFDSPELFRNVKFKSLTAGYINQYRMKSFNQCLLPIIAYHPELEEIIVFNSGKFEKSGEVAKAMLRMQNLKSIELKVTDDDWNEILQEVGRSQIKDIKINLLNCGHEKLTSTFFHYKYNADLSLYWRMLTNIKIKACYGNVNLNLILDNLPHLVSIDCVTNESTFTPTQQVYPNIKKIKKIDTKSGITPVVDLLNALPSLQEFISQAAFNIEVLRKIASMNLKSITIYFQRVKVPLATDEFFSVFGEINKKMLHIHMDIPYSDPSFETSLRSRIDNYDYCFEPIQIYRLLGGFNIKKGFCNVL